MRQTFALAFAACAIAAAPAAAADAIPPCAPRGDILKMLGTDFGEVRRTIGLAENGFVIETFAGETGDWTILATRPTGISCVIASGHWFETTAEAVKAGDPA